ncbi:MAG: hypothetical protein AAF675_00610 [Pseudomonadota bacterium]
MGAVSGVHITGGGAVTSLGLSAAQTLAGLRAGLVGFEKLPRPEAFPLDQIMARVPADWRLKPTPADWLANLAARAIMEAVRGLDPERTAVLLAGPEPFREHPAGSGASLAETAQARALPAGASGWHRGSAALPGGAAAVIESVEMAVALLQAEDVDAVILGGADSLLGESDLTRLSTAGRLLGDESPQGLVPGEGAAVLRLESTPAAGGESRQRSRAVSGPRLRARIAGVGKGEEPRPVTGPDYSLGTGLGAALRGAAEGDGGEPGVGFIIHAGAFDRYDAMETLLAHPRFFRTRREELPICQLATGLGDTGAAAGALALLVAADSFGEGYAPPGNALCEAVSEAGGRAAAILTPA